MNPEFFAVPAALGARARSQTVAGGVKTGEILMPNAAKHPRNPFATAHEKHAKSTTTIQPIDDDRGYESMNPGFGTTNAALIWNGRSKKARRPRSDKRSGKDNQASKSVQKGRKAKDSNAPKKAMSAYLFFSVEKRVAIKAQTPEATFGELGRLVGAAWRALAAVERAPYEAKAKVDAARYAAEVQAIADEDNCSEDAEWMRLVDLLEVMPEASGRVDGLLDEVLLTSGDGRGRKRGRGRGRQRGRGRGRARGRGRGPPLRPPLHFHTSAPHFFLSGAPPPFPSTAPRVFPAPLRPSARPPLRRSRCREFTEGGGGAAGAPAAGGGVTGGAAAGGRGRGPPLRPPLHFHTSAPHFFLSGAPPLFPSAAAPPGFSSAPPPLHPSSAPPL
jgi:hypothetical protein